MFKNEELLRKINLAQNMLSVSILFNKTFSALFKRNLLLEDINIENNGLVYLPKDVFVSNNNLERVYLSGNRFKQITFDVSHLKFLNVVDMRKNNIGFLDAPSRNTLDELYSLQKKNTNRTVHVDLQGNPLSCDCQSLEFLQWFVSARHFTSTRHVYFCTTNGKTYQMNEIAVKVAEENCERPKRRRRIIIVTSVVSSAGLVVIAVGLVIILKQRKRKMLQKHFEDRVKLLRGGDFEFKFLAFLSFASEDDMFVVPHILRPLKVGKEKVYTVIERGGLQRK